MEIPYNCKSNGVPVISRREIDKIANTILSCTQPDCLKRPQKTDMDILIRGYLKMNYEERYLTHNALFLGMTVFKDAEIIIYNPKKKSAEYIKVPHNTLIIDKSLCDDPKKTGIKHFTQAHEAGHVVLHRKYYEGLDEYNCSMSDEESVSIIASGSSPFTDNDWLEWQANNFASSVLMPETAVNTIWSRYKDVDPDKRVNIAVVALSSIFEVSEQAALIRLKTLGLVDRCYTPEINEIKYLRQFSSGLRLNRNDGI